jgi:hypothetical protein
MSLSERKEKLGSFSGLENHPEPQKRVTPTSRDPNMLLINIDRDKHDKFIDKCAKYEHSSEQEILKSLVDNYINATVVPQMSKQESDGDTLSHSKIPLFLPSQTRSLLVDKCERGRLNMYSVLTSLIENFIDGSIIIEQKYPFESSFSVSPQSPVRAISKPFLVSRNAS